MGPFEMQVIDVPLATATEENAAIGIPVDDGVNQRIGLETEENPMPVMVTL